MPTRISTPVMVLSAIVLAGLLAPVATAGPADSSGARIQREVVATIDAFETVLDTPASSPGILEGLAEARAQVVAMPPDSFEALDPMLVGRLARLRELAAQIRAAVSAQKRGTTDRTESDGLPTADYPVITFDFVIHASVGIPDEDGDTSGFDFGWCTQDMAPNAEMKFILLNASLLGNALRDTARRLCDQTVIIAGEGANLAPVCIVSDIAFLLIRGIQDNMFLCSASMSGAEVTGSYNRLGHIHDDLVASESNLLSQIGSIEATLTSELNFNESRIRNITNDLALHDQNLEQRVQGIMAGLDHLADELAAFREDELRIRIECALADAEARGIGVFLLPEQLGGHIDSVHTIVAETISAVVATGGDVGNAERLLDGAWQLAMAGDYAAAYAEYGRAYRAATR